MSTPPLQKLSNKLFPGEDKPEHADLQPDSDAPETAKVAGPQPQEPQSRDKITDATDKQREVFAGKNQYGFVEGEETLPRAATRRASHPDKRVTKPGEDPEVYDLKPEEFRRRSTTEGATGKPKESKFKLHVFELGT